MTEQQTPVMTPPAAPPAAPTGPKKKRKGRGKTIAGILIVAAIAIALVVLVWYFVFREDGSKGEVMTDFVTRGSIQSMVEGSGTSKAKDSATVTPGSGTILELFVQEGDQVTAGQQLYRMDDTTARDAVTEAQKSVDNCNKELQAVYDKIAELSITAPHAGNLREVADLKVGDTVKEGDTIATLVNDTKLRLSLYYSYAYEGDIKVGQTAQISIPAIMAPVTGKVEQINKVRFVSPEGATHFEVVLVLDNPGTLAEGMDASAGLTAADGTPIYPYQNGKLEYYESTKITAKATGPVERVSLLDYGDVKAGQLLVQLGAKDTDEEIASKENALKAAQEKLEDYTITSTIDGEVIEKNLDVGDNISGLSNSGASVTYPAIIYDRSELTFDMDVDEKDISKIQVGQKVEITAGALDDQSFTGVVDKININGTTTSGHTSYPVTVKVEGSPEALYPGMNVSAKIIVEEVGSVLALPVEAVERGNTVLVAKEGCLDENGVIKDLSAAEERQVTLGRNDDEYIEIVDGLEEGEVVLALSPQGSSLMSAMGMG